MKKILLIFALVSTMIFAADGEPMKFSLIGGGIWDVWYLQLPPSRNTNIYGLKFGFLTTYNDSYGLSFHALKSNDRSFGGISLSVIANETEENMGGLQIALINLVGGNLYGGQVGFLNGVTGDTVGFQIGLVNANGIPPAVEKQEDVEGQKITGNMTGFQFGVFNSTVGTFNGLQFGAFYNYSQVMNGFQIGAFNFAGKLQGVQIGLFNVIRNRENFNGIPIMNLNFSF
ncbi:MAG: LA_2272 family surface repeat-containing protein [Fusobacteriaceae bacterium]